MKEASLEGYVLCSPVSCHLWKTEVQWQRPDRWPAGARHGEGCEHEGRAQGCLLQVRELV